MALGSTCRNTVLFRVQELALLFPAGNAAACCIGRRIGPRAAAALSQILAIARAPAAFCWGLYCSVGLWDVRPLGPVLRLKRGEVFLATAYQKRAHGLSV